MKLGMKTGILAAETALSAETGGLFLPVELITGGVFGVMALTKKVKEHRQEKKDSKANEQRARDEEAQRQRDMEAIARQQELDRLEAERKAQEEAERKRQEEEQKRQEEERKAQEEQRQQEEAKRQEEERQRQIQQQIKNQEDIQRVQLRDIQIMDQLNIDRMNRINALEGRGQWDNYDPNNQGPPRYQQRQLYNNVPIGYGLDWMNYVPRDQIQNYQQIMESRNLPIPPEGNNQVIVRPGQDGHGQRQPQPPPDDLRQRREQRRRQRQNPVPVPDGGGGGGGGGGDGGGGDLPAPAPDYEDNQINRINNIPSAPYNELILRLATQIALSRQRDEEKARQEQEQKQNPVPQPNPSSDVVPDPSPPPPIQIDPARADTHIIENEILAVLAGQSMAELTNEQQVAELDKIQKSIPQQVQIDPSNVFSSTLVSF